jgi:hypothetical protein
MSNTNASWKTDGTITVFGPDGKIVTNIGGAGLPSSNTVTIVSPFARVENTDTTKYVDLKDIPQEAIEAASGEITKLHFDAVVNGVTGRVLVPAHDVLALVSIAAEYYCPDCANWSGEENYEVSSATEVRVFWVDPETLEMDWDETEGEFCAECHNEYLWGDADSYFDDAKDDYDSDRWADDEY